MEQFLSDTDIRKLIPSVKILVYSELKKVKRIEDILPKYNSKICLLYETEPKYKGVSIGHWVCLFNAFDRGVPYVEFFDSYGTYPDDELSKTIYKGPGLLNKLLLDFMERGGLVQYNNYEFQYYDKNVNTCGKHCVMRLRNNDIDIELYKKFLDTLIPLYEGQTKKYDRIVTDFYDY